MAQKLACAQPCSPRLAFQIRSRHRSRRAPERRRWPPAGHTANSRLFLLGARSGQREPCTVYSPGRCRRALPSPFGTRYERPPRHGFSRRGPCPKRPYITPSPIASRCCSKPGLLARAGTCACCATWRCAGSRSFRAPASIRTCVCSILPHRIWMRSPRSACGSLATSHRRSASRS